MIKRVGILNKRGLNLSVILSTPDLGKSKKAPIVVLLQGFLGKKEGEKITSLSSCLSGLGFATIRFDYAGYGESEGETDEEYLVSNIIDDILCLIDFIKRQPNVDASRIATWGQSMGGMLAIIFASLHPEIKAVCAVSTPVQITKGDDLEKLLPEWKKRGYLERKNSNNEIVRVSYNFVNDVRNYDVKKSVKSLRVPLMVVLGTTDETVPPRVTREIFDNASEPKELLEIEGMPHDYKEGFGFGEIVNKASCNFLKKFL